MTALTRIAVPLAIVLVPCAYAFDMPETKVSMETCLKAALAKVPGQVTALKLEIEDGKPLYEFKLASEDDRQWEIECDAMTGVLSQLERKADRNDREFSAAAKIVESEARRTALQRYPGKVTGSELEMANDRPVFEVEIQASNGEEIEVKVDAVSGEILSAEKESDGQTVYEIGED
jgi:uncharacterized membrane protein YkoI